MNIKQFKYGTDNLSYLIYGENSVLAIDGGAVEAILDFIGSAGLELQYDDVLTGSGGSRSREVAPNGRSIPGSETVTEQPIAGDDLVLTLDRSIQFSTEQVLLEKVSEIGARGATAIVIETKTGEVLSMASVRLDAEAGVYQVTSGNIAAVDE